MDSNNHDFYNKEKCYCLKYFWTFPDGYHRPCCECQNTSKVHNQEITTGNFIILKISVWKLQLSHCLLKSLVHSESICHKKGTHLWQTLKLMCFSCLIDAMKFDRPTNNFCKSVSVGRLRYNIRHGFCQLRNKSKQHYSAAAAFAIGMQWTKQELPQIGQQFPPNTGIGKMCERITSTCSNERTIPMRPRPPLCRQKGILTREPARPPHTGNWGSESCKMMLPVFLDDWSVTA